MTLLYRCFVFVVVSSVVVGCGEEEDPLPGPSPSPVVGYCSAVTTWDAAWVDFENEVLRLTNLRRAAGANCDTEGVFAPAPPLTFDGLLRCAARNQSRNLGRLDFFAHTDPNGDDVSDRVDNTGYVWQAVGENIAAGQMTPADVVDGWIDSDGHCANLMEPLFTELGVGYYYDAEDTYAYGPGYAPYYRYWTQVFGNKM